MKMLSRFLATLLITCVVLGLAACGNSFNSGQSVQGQPTQNAMTPTSPATQSPAGQPTHTPTSQAQIILSPDKVQYTTRERIQVTITNHLTTPIFVSAYYTNCTYVSLQRQAQNSWLSLGRCPSAVTHSVALQPGASLVQQLIPIANTPQMAAHALWPAGSYRVALFYALSPDEDTTQGKSILSPTFLIQ